jgi:exopolysaccharide biosynthesis polyprenyl glycosylphosphotransferase
MQYYDQFTNAMSLTRRKEALVLFVGDVLIFAISLWLTLLLRYEIFPTTKLFLTHLAPFSILFVLWSLSYFIAGLYDRTTTVLQRQLPTIIIYTQVVNAALAGLFFFFIPYFGITPKTNLIIYLMVSSVLMLFWRLYIFPRFGMHRKGRAVLIGSGREVMELVEEVQKNPHHHYEFECVVDTNVITNPNDIQKKVLEHVGLGRVSMVVCNTHGEEVSSLLPLLYNLTFLNTSVQFVDIYRVYEDVFNRVPLSLLRYDWFLHNVSPAPKRAYEFLKRVMDVGIAVILGVLSLIVYPFVWIAIKMDDGGSLFVVQERIGANNKPIRIAKFRSMSGNDTGKEVLQSKHEITRVGRILRKTRIDELPQLWSVIKGDQSLIGPRPELPELAHHYAEFIPYYNARHLIKPGLSGWAQIWDYDVPRKGADVERTKRKLAYDLYYVKNRSVLLDLHIALKTIKTLLSRSGT